MKNHFFVLGLLLGNIAFGQGNENYLRLGLEYFRSYNETMRENISEKLVYAAERGKLQAFKDEKLSIPLDAKQVYERRRSEDSYNVLFDSNSIYSTYDSIVVSVMEIFEKVVTINFLEGIPSVLSLKWRDCSRDTTSFFSGGNDYLSFKYDEAMPHLSEQEVNWLIASQYFLRTSSDQICLDSASLAGFAASTLRYLDSTLYSLTINALLPVYSNDSMNQTLTKEEIQKKLILEGTELGYRSINNFRLEDSLTKSAYIRPKDAAPIRYCISWEETSNGSSYKVKNISATFKLYAGGMNITSPIAMLKLEDVSKFISSDMYFKLKQVIQHSIQLRMKNYNETYWDKLSSW